MVVAKTSRRAVVLAVAALLLFAGCGGDPSLDEGKVVGKVYDDPDDWYQAGYTIPGGQTCTGGYNGQPQTCTRRPSIHIPGQWHHDPERFLLDLEGPHPDDAGKTLKDRVSVPGWFYDKVREGQWVDVEALEIIPR